MSVPCFRFASLLERWTYFLFSASRINSEVNILCLINFVRNFFGHSIISAFSLARFCRSWIASSLTTQSECVNFSLTVKPRFHLIRSQYFSSTLINSALYLCKIKFSSYWHNYHRINFFLFYFITNECTATIRNDV